jgi:hypothetical protein
MSEPGFARNLVDVQLRGFQEFLRPEHPLRVEPRRRCGTRFGPEPPGERPGGHVQPGRQFVDAVVTIEVLHHPTQQCLHGRRAARGHGPVDELGLAAVAVRRNHHVARNGRSDIGAQLHTDQMQAGINTGGRAGT